MTGLDQYLNDPEYANWVKNTLASRITLNVLKPFVHQNLPAIETLITDKCPPRATCSLCNVRQAPDCPNDVCNVYKKGIIDNHRQGEPSFVNTNAKKWKADTWEIAKCFMPPFPVYKYCTPSEADFSAVINIIINCKHFDTLVSCDLNRNRNVFCEARTMRNMLMHPRDFKVSETNLQENLDILTILLKCLKKKPSNTSEALDQIEKLKTGKLRVTLDDVLDAHKQVAFAVWEEVDKGKQEIEKFVDLSVDRIRKEMQTTSSIWTVSQHRRIANFVKGCKYSLVRLVEIESESERPKRYQGHEWNFQKFLDKIELFPDVKTLLDRHKRFLYPEDGSPSDINKWDIFLLCHILSLQIKHDEPNHLVNYVQELKVMRDEILDNLDNPGCIGEENLEMLSGLLDEPLRTELKIIYAGEDITDNVLHLQYVLKSWQENDDIMECRKIRMIELQTQNLLLTRIDQAEIRQNKFDKRQDEFQKQLDELRLQFSQTNRVEKPEHFIGQICEEFQILRKSGSMALENENMIETAVRVQPINCDPEEEKQMQDNITSEDVNKNVAISNGGLNHFKKQENLDNAKIGKGSIILKVTCKSIKELIRFWDSCMDGSAVRSLSKIRDDYREFLGCGTLDLDIVLTKKEVHRCVSLLVERMLSRLQDEDILKEIQVKVTRLQTVLVAAEDASKEKLDIVTEESDRDSQVSEDAQQVGKEGTTPDEIFKQTRVSLEEVHDVSGDVHNVPKEIRNVPEEMHDVPEEIRQLPCFNMRVTGRRP